MIEISNVTKTYNPKKSNAFTALKNVSLTINDGEMIAIIGKSGAGTSSDTSSEPASSTPGYVDSAASAPESNPSTGMAAWLCRFFR